jgi:hypothetical protein
MFLYTMLTLCVWGCHVHQKHKTDFNVATNSVDMTKRLRDENEDPNEAHEFEDLLKFYYGVYA